MQKTPSSFKKRSKEWSIKVNHVYMEVCIHVSMDNATFYLLEKTLVSVIHKSVCLPETPSLSFTEQVCATSLGFQEPLL